MWVSPNIIWAIKLRRMKWAVHAPHMGERRGVSRVSVGKPVENHLEDPGVDGRIIVKWIFKKKNEGVRTGYIWLSMEQVAGLYECSNKPLDSIKCGEFPY